MKKVFLMLGMAAFVLASCCGNKQGECAAECEKKCEKK